MNFVRFSNLIRKWVEFDMERKPVMAVKKKQCYGGRITQLSQQLSLRKQERKAREG
jgi:hypothetical protein